MLMKKANVNSRYYDDICSEGTNTTEFLSYNIEPVLLLLNYY